MRVGIQATNAIVRRPWILIRYADVLLMYVEALIDAPGPVADVYTKIDLVSSRRDARFTNWFNSGSNA